MQIHLDDATKLRLEAIARETGRTIADLAESAVSEEALSYFRSRAVDPGTKTRLRQTPVPVVVSQKEANRAGHYKIKQARWTKLPPEQEKCIFRRLRQYEEAMTGLTVIVYWGLPIEGAEACEG